MGSLLGEDAASREAVRASSPKPTGKGWGCTWGLHAGCQSRELLWRCRSANWLGEWRCWCRDAVEFIAVFWDLLASQSLGTSPAATLRQQWPLFLSMRVCNVSREVLGAVWCWCWAQCLAVAVCLSSRAAPACRQALAEPPGHAHVHLFGLLLGFCACSLSDGWI